MSLSAVLGILLAMGLAVFVAVDETRKGHLFLAAIYELCAVILLFTLLGFGFDGGHLYAAR